MNMNFGVLDLDFDELEPKVEMPSLSDLSSEISSIDLPPPATEPEHALKVEETRSPALESAEPREQPVVMETAEPDAAEDAVTEPCVQPASAETADPIAADDAVSEGDFEAVDPALAPVVPSSNLVFDPIPEETELDVNGLDVSEDMSLESI